MCLHIARFTDGNLHGLLESADLLTDVGGGIVGAGGKFTHFIRHHSKAAPGIAQLAALAGLPVLSIRAERSDVLSAATQAEMAKRLPGLRCVTVPRVGHPPTLAEPVVAAALGVFLEQVA